MDLPSDSATSDLWFDWLMHRRHADDSDYGQKVHADVARYADHVLDGAALKRGMTLVDLGAGDGLVGFRAIDRIGASLKVIMVDISVPLLNFAERSATSRGVRQQCTFLVSSAEQLGGLNEDSVDAVTTRSSLAYVADKQAALRECFRILKPGGRLSIAEPVFRDDALATASMKTRLESGERDRKKSILPLLHRWRSTQYPDTYEGIQSSPISNYSERDLLQWAQKVGFRELRLELRISVTNAYRKSWEVFIDSSPHPLAPTLRTILCERFTTEERQLFEAVVRPMVLSSELSETDRMAYLTALKPQLLAAK
jgi:ubiquinone/menaquinone biosynthesis C-methylase UbiE